MRVFSAGKNLLSSFFSSFCLAGCISVCALAYAAGAWDLSIAHAANTGGGVYENIPNDGEKAYIGAFSLTGNASNAHVEMDTIFNGNIYGGYSLDGASTNNRVTIHNGVFSTGTESSGLVVGGYSAGGNATGNTVSVYGGRFGVEDAGVLYGGRSAGGDATHNTVRISGGSFGGDAVYMIYGGYSDSGNATHNTVTILGAPVFNPSTEIWGGATGGISRFRSLSDTRTGNTLNMFTHGITVGQVGNFQFYNFALFGGGGAGLTIDSITLKATDVVAAPYALPNSGFKVGDSVTLLATEDTIDPFFSVPGTAASPFMKYGYSIRADAKNIIAEITDVNIDPQSGSYTQGQRAGAALLNMGANLAAGAGMGSARAAAETQGLSSGSSSIRGFVPFMAVNASSIRYSTSGHTDSEGFGLLAGVAKLWENPSVNILAGAFFEYASGTFKGKDIYANSVVHSRGNNHSYGGGLLARVEAQGNLAGLYGEASFRLGNLESKYSDNRVYIDNLTPSYKTNRMYYGVHVGFGYAYALGQQAYVDVSAKYFWNHQAKKNTSVLGEYGTFQADNSPRVRLGARVSYAFTENFSPYLGAAWEYTFGSKAKVTAYGQSAYGPSTKGSTGIGELGITFTPSTSLPLFFDLGLQGYVGKQRGVSGALQMKLKF